MRSRDVVTFRSCRARDTVTSSDVFGWNLFREVFQARVRIGRFGLP